MMPRSSVTGRPSSRANRRVRHLAGRTGFSLLELVLVVSMIMIMTAIIGPTFRITPTRQVENMAHLIATELEMARAEALGNRETIRVDFDVAGRTYTAYVDHDDDGTISGVAAEALAFPEFGTRELDDRVIFGRGAALALPGDAGSGEVTFASDRFTLDNQGIPTPWGTMGTIYLTHTQSSSAVAAISVASSGSFKAWRWWPSPGEWR
jgi:type II secretory pathway pseudopilin PulG